MKRTGKYTIAIGLLIIVAGFIYDIMFAGIPYQDPPVELQIKYDHNQKIASQIMTAGQYGLAAGILIWLGGLLKQAFRKER